MHPRILLIIASLLFNCTSQSSNELVIELEQSADKEIAFLDSYMRFPLQFFHKKYPLFYSSQLSKYKNLPKDNFYLVFAYTDHNNFLYNLHKDNLIENNKYNNLSRRSNLDSVLEQKKGKLELLTAVTGIKDEKQYLIVDTNNDYDFGDENFVIFEIDSNNQVLNIPEYSYKYNFITNNVSEKFNRKIMITPNPEYIHFQHEEDSLAKKLAIIGKFKQYWEGNIYTKSNQNYNVAVQGFNSKYLNILIKPDSLKFSEVDEFYNNNFKYQVNDTIKLVNELFVLDSVNSYIDKIHFKKLNSDRIRSTGWRIGENIDNFNYTSLKGDTLPIFSAKEKYTLLYFWGTWCIPCRKMTPRLKEIHDNFTEKIDIVGVAYDKSAKDVHSYAEKNQLQWQQTFISFNERNHFILKDLNISTYPTLILVDSKHKIVYRGSDYSALDEIEKVFTDGTN